MTEYINSNVPDIPPGYTNEKDKNTKGQYWETERTTIRGIVTGVENAQPRTIMGGEYLVNLKMSL